ncbi:unnamed protein product [Rhodiola kirilowii]
MRAALENGGLMPASQFLVKISAFVFLSAALLYFGKRWSDADQQLLFSNYGQFTASVTSQPPIVALSLNYNIPSSVQIVPNKQVVAAVPPQMTNPPPFSSPSPAGSDNFSSLQPPPPRPLLERFGIVDENGTMSDEFRVGNFNSEIEEVLRNVTSGSEDEERLFDDGGIGIGVTRFPPCPSNMTDYIPCFDNVDAVKTLKSAERGEQFERHCPEKGKGLNCLVPRPKDYKRPIPWPKSRDEVWYSNVLHTQLVEDTRDKNWISVDKDMFRFPGGDTQFNHGADEYINQISKMAPAIAFGQRTRVVLDVGCGVASFGAYLMSRNVLTLSIASKDVHKNPIQFALERGVPAMVSAFATHRLLYPSQAFDLIHCSGCGIDWTRDDGILLLEVDRMLRAGGYFVWAAQPNKVNFEEQWKLMADLTTRLCWELVKKEGYIAIWRKPQNKICYVSRQEETRPPLCDKDDDQDSIWYVDLKACISQLPEKNYGANVSTWPMRLNNPPERLETINIDASISRKELFRAESKYGDEIVGSLVKYMQWKKKKIEFRNVLDMRAGFGGFGAAFINQKIDCWVMNVVPISGPNTLPVIYDRGLVGVMHDWCEPFDTYPRTYDLLHASGLFSVERSRCDMGSIMLEMDRILRPGGYAYIQDSVSVIYKLQELGNAINWHVQLQDTSEGPHASYKVLFCQKPLDQENTREEKAKHGKRRKKNHKHKNEHD